MSKKEIIFWAYFVLLNALLFVPKFLIDSQTSSFLPQFLNEETLSEQFKYFFRRGNQDPFRISIDFLLLTWLLLAFNNKILSTAKLKLITCLYLGWFFYQLYQGIMLTLYNQDALFYNDYYLILEGWSLLKAEAHWWVFLAAILGIIIMIIGITNAFKAYKKSIYRLSLSKYSKAILIVISLFSVISIIDYHSRLDDVRLVFPSKTYWAINNAVKSVQIYNTIQSFDTTAFKANHNYKHHRLLKKPNIYLIFIESYGGVLYDNKLLKNDYLKIIDEKEQLLSRAGWAMASTFSESPVVGGRSWLAYTSFLLGAKIDKHTFYQYFVNNPQYDLPTMFKSLKAEGYRSYWLSVLEDKRGDIPYEDYRLFYGFDQWIKFQDLNYHGKRFGIFSAPPDQYSLNYAHQKIQAAGSDPFFLFFITLNSHHPFDTPTDPSENWQLLANAGEQLENEKGLSVESDYITAIKYQFDYLTDFVIDNGTENDLFILIGDHQPPIVTNQFPSKKTPVHIISKDASLVKGFQQYGMSPGLKVQYSELNNYHAGFYSMIMRELFINYGGKDVKPPSHLPEGAIWQNTER